MDEGARLQATPFDLVFQQRAREFSWDAQLRTDRLRTIWDNRIRSQAEAAEGLCHGVEDRPECFSVARILGQCPWRSLVDILIGKLNDVPNGFERPIKFQLFKVARQHFVQERHRGLFQFSLCWSNRSGSRQQPGLRSFDEGQCTTQKIAQTIGKIAIDSCDHPCKREVSILPKGNLSQ